MIKNKRPENQIPSSTKNLVWHLKKMRASVWEKKKQFTKLDMRAGQFHLEQDFIQNRAPDSASIRSRELRIIMPHFG